jgi:hypothetical protein
MLRPKADAAGRARCLVFFRRWWRGAGNRTIEIPPEAVYKCFASKISYEQLFKRHAEPPHEEAEVGIKPGSCVFRRE